MWMQQQNKQNEVSVGFQTAFADTPGPLHR